LRTPPPYGEREVGARLPLIRPCGATFPHGGRLGVYLYIIHSYHPAGAGDFLAACGPLGGLYTVLSFPPFSIIDKIQTREPDAGRM